jgi:hypothetical protein
VATFTFPTLNCTPWFPDKFLFGVAIFTTHDPLLLFGLNTVWFFIREYGYPKKDKSSNLNSV